MRRGVAWWILLSLFLVGGCATRGEVIRFKEQLSTIEARVGTVDSLSQEEVRLLIEMRADLYSRLTRLDERMEVLETKLEDSQGRLERLTEKLGKTPIRAPQDTLQSPTGSTSQDLYDTAYLDYIQGRYDLALSGFREYLRIHPGEDLSDNAQYWIGECLLTQGKFEEAFAEFEKVLNLYPKGNKASSALYKMAILSVEREEKEVAKKYLKRILEEYPHAPEVPLAREKLNTLG